MALSAQTYQGDGVNTDFVLDFTLGYISTTHIFVFVDEVEIPQNTLTFINGGGSVRLPTPPADGSQVLVRRIVPNDRLLHDYENGALVIEENLDESNKQAVMLQHESIDGFVSKGAGQDLNMSGLRIINLADAIDPGDAVNYQTLLQYEGQLQSTTAQGVATIQQAEADAIAAIADDVQEVADNAVLVQGLADDFDTKYIGEVVALPDPTGRPEGQLAYLLGQGLRIIEQGVWSLAAAAPDEIFQADLDAIGARVTVVEDTLAEQGVTLLWSGLVTTETTITLTADITNFDMIAIEGYTTESNGAQLLGISALCSPTWLLAQQYHLHSIAFSDANTAPADFTRHYSYNWTTTAATLSGSTSASNGEVWAYTAIRGIKY